MADPRFFQRAGPFTVAELAELIDAEIDGDSDRSLTLEDVAPLDMAGSADLSFLDNTKYLPALADTKAGACIVRPEHADRTPGHTIALVTQAPYKAYALAAQEFYPGQEVEDGISPEACVSPLAEIGDHCTIAAGAVIGAGAVLGARTSVKENAVIEPGVVIGRDCSIGPGASLSYCRIGDNVRIYPGVRIGQDGFGFAPDPAGHVKVPQLGLVVVGDNVEIGANTCIDRGSGPNTVIGAAAPVDAGVGADFNRGSGPNTVIGEGCWIDNLVQIGHNVELGRSCIVVSQVGISGSTKIGDYVVLGGQVGIAGHLQIGAGAQIAAKSGVIKDVPAATVVGGYPAQPVKDWHRQSIVLARLVKERRQKQ